MNRKYFFQQTAALVGASMTIPFWARANEFESNPQMKYARIRQRGSAAPEDIPEGLRILKTYSYFSIHSEKDVAFFDCLDLENVQAGSIYLRLQVALDHKTEDEVGVYLGNSNRKIGHMSIWYPTSLQIFETALDCTVAELKKEGMRLRLEGGSYCSFFFETSDQNGSHLLIVDKHLNNTGEAWRDILCSDRSLQPFSWTEGCVLDGLQELYSRKGDPKALAAIKKHLQFYLPNDQELIYADLMGRPVDNTINNLETGLTFAIIAQYQPKHSSIPLFIDFCKSRFGDNNATYKPLSVTTEGCYTLAYPLAVMGKQFGSNELYELALLEIEKRVDFLTDENAVYGIGHFGKGKSHIRRNWGRGYAWFLLGIVRTVELLERDSPFKGTARLAKLKDVYRYYANLAIKFQQPDHSWSAFLDQPHTHFESSATSGLAAAFAHGHRIGWLPEFDKRQLRQVYDRLMPHITADGFLKDVSQHNAGSINLLQRGKYRVIAQYALGFLGHIRAHL